MVTSKLYSPDATSHHAMSHRSTSHLWVPHPMRHLHIAGPNVLRGFHRCDCPIEKAFSEITAKFQFIWCGKYFYVFLLNKNCFLGLKPWPDAFLPWSPPKIDDKISDLTSFFKFTMRLRELWGFPPISLIVKEKTLLTCNFLQNKKRERRPKGATFSFI